MADNQSGHEADIGLFARYALPALATITSLSFMAAASAMIGVWRDVSVMRENMAVLVRHKEEQKLETDELQKQVQNHEVRITRGGL